jgi:hypothetical protein
LRAVEMKSPIFWDTTPCSPWKSTDGWKERVLSICNMSRALLLLCLFFCAEMEEVHSSGTTSDFQRNTRCYVPEDITLWTLNAQWYLPVWQHLPFYVAGNTE